MKQVSILTGFLGAGKTTLLNEIITHKKDRKFAIIENEVGAEGIDGELVTKADDELFELNNGCLCCSLNDNLTELLQKLYNQASKFDELVIETTGIADPAGVAAAFWQLPGIERFYHIRSVICLVDAELIEDQLEETDEAMSQISFSDIILINKTKNVSPVYITKLNAILTKLNPMAKILVEENGEFSIDTMWKQNRSEIIESSEEKRRDTAHHHTHFKHGKITALSFKFKEAFDIEMLQNRLLVFMMFQASSIYRVKGIIHATGYERKLILQSVKTNIALTTGNGWNEKEERGSRIVIIGRNLESTGFEKMLRTCFADQQVVQQ